MKLISVSILILLLQIQTFNTWFVVISFNLNRDYIAKTLCENRSRPELKCKGNCVLAKKMKQQEQQEENNQAPTKIETTSLVLSSRSFFATLDGPVFISTNSFTHIPESGKPIDRATVIFHPPAIC